MKARINNRTDGKGQVLSFSIVVLETIFLQARTG